MEVTEVKQIDVNQLVKIEQMPIVFEQLEMIGAYIDEQTKDLEKLACTEENKQEVKKRKIEINNTLKLLEEKRKEIKNKINEPYDIFNKKYEETTKIKLQNAVKLLSDKIDKIENEQKAKKEDIIRKYFEEYKLAQKIDFVTFEQAKLNITLGASEKSLREQAKAFLDKIADDLLLIESQTFKDEILIEYKKDLNVSQAITKVVARHKELEEMQKRKEEQEVQKKLEQERVQKVEQVLSAPVKKEVQEKPKLLRIDFSVIGTEQQLKELVKFLREGGYQYEQLNN